MKKWLAIPRDLGLQLLAFYLLLVVPFLVTVLISDRLVGVRIRGDVEANDIALARAIALETDISINNSLETVRRLATYPGVIEPDLDIMEKTFSIVMDSRPDINLVYRLDAEGIMLFHQPIGPGSTVGTDFSFRDYYQQALVSDHPLISEGRISPTTDQAVATAVMPIRSAEGDFLGLVGTNIKLQSLSDTLGAIVSEHNLEEGFDVYILDASGQVIAYDDPAQLLKSASDLLPIFYKEALEGNSGSVVDNGPDGIERLYTFTNIPSVNWGVIISRPTSSAFAARMFLTTITAITIATFLLIGLAFWGILSWRVINPIEKLTPISESIGLNQELGKTQRMQIEKMSKRSDQIGHLIRSILRMENIIAERLREQATLLQTSNSVVSSLDLGTVLDRILEQVGRLLHVQKIAIIALDQERGEFRIRASRGLSSSFTNQISIQPSDPSSVSMRALRVKEPIQVSDTEDDPSYKPYRERARAEGYRAILSVPLNTQHAPPTCLLIYHTEVHKFTPNEMQLVTTFANQATMAIENAILYERSDTRLQEQTHRLEALIQSMEDGLILGDLKGNVIYANRRFIELAEYFNEDIEEIPVKEVMASILNRSESIPDDVNTEALLEGSPGKVDISINNADRIINLRIETFEVTDAHEIPIGLGVILQDITIDRELDRMKSNLISTVSHELRTPLASIKGYASTLLAEDVKWDGNTQKEFISIISNETDRLSSLVDNLLDLSRIEAGSLKLSLQKCEIEEMISRAALQAQMEPGNNLEIQVEPGLPDLFLDEPRIETVIRNLIENSVKYGGSNATIKVVVSQEQEEIIFRVKDNGPGIPLDKQEQVFDRFFRLDESLARTQGGAGLGLSICQGLVRAHNGEIWVEPVEEGTTIAFSIPLDLLKLHGDNL
jgi:signal transduction histidine kinase